MLSIQPLHFTYLDVESQKREMSSQIHPEIALSLDLVNTFSLYLGKRGRGMHDERRLPLSAVQLPEATPYRSSPTPLLISWKVISNSELPVATRELGDGAKTLPHPGKGSFFSLLYPEEQP